MASSIKGINIKIGADTKGLDEALKGIESKSKKTNDELREVNKALKTAPESAELWAQKQTLLAKAIEESREKVDLLSSAQAEITKKFKNGEIDEGAYRTFQREVEKAKGQTQNLEKQLTDTGKKIQSIGNEAEKSGENIESLGDAAEESGKKAEKSHAGYASLAAGIAAIGAAAIKSMKMADEMEQSYDTLVKKTGATGSTLDIFKGNTNNVFASIPTDLDKAATAVGEVNTRFALTGKTLEDVSQKFIKFSEINDTDLNNSIGTTDKIIEQWNLDIQDLDGLLGLITSKAQETGICVDSLMNSVQNNGATFKEMGLDIGESISLLAQFEANGVNADTAMAGLKKAIKNATDEGVPLSQALSKTISDIQTASDETEALATAQELFGTKGAPEMARAIREGRIDLKSLTADMGKYKDVVSETYEATLSPSEKMKTLTNQTKLSIGSLGNELNKTILPVINYMLPKVEDGLKWVNEHLPQFLTNIKYFGKSSAEIVEEAYKGEHEAAQKARDEIKKLEDDFKNSAKSTDEECDRIESLWNSLAILADAEGNVSDKNKARADYIMRELNEALGVELTWTDNQIQGYKDLAREIDNVVAKKRAEAYLESYRGNLSDMISLKNASKSKYLELSAQRDSAKARRDEALLQIEALRATERADGWNFYDKEGYEISQKYVEANNEYVQASSAMREFEAAYGQAVSYLNKLDEAETAMANGAFDDVEKILYATKDATKELSEIAKEEKDKILKTYNDSVEEVTRTLALARRNNSEDDKKTAMDTMLEIVEIGREKGLTCGELFSEGMCKEIEAMAEQGFDLSALYIWAQNEGINLGEILGKNCLTAYTQWLYDYSGDNLIQKTINSQWDAEMRAQGKYATGGYISSGNRAIVAEGGPEMISVMNGGVRVTPLSPNSRNTALSEVGGVTKNFYNTYQINATISSDMDIRTLSQKLAAENKRVEVAKGMG